MPARIAAGDRVRVRPSGETGRIARGTQAADGRPTYDVEFDTPRGSGAGMSGETGGLNVAEDIEPA